MGCGASSAAANPVKSDEREPDGEYEEEAAAAGMVAGLPDDWGAHELFPVTTKLEVSDSTLVVLEPWEHVGHNTAGEEVRASLNVAVLARSILQWSSCCVPLWHTGTDLPPAEVSAALKGKKFVFEGGAPDVYDQASFSHPKCPRSYLLDVYKRVLCMRHETREGVFVCLSHQLVMSGLVELVKDAVKALLGTGSSDVESVAREIDDVGSALDIIKSGAVIATGYNHLTDAGWDQFATARNEAVEAELLRLHKFVSPVLVQPGELGRLLVDAHEAYSKDKHGEIEKMLNEETDGLYIAMFHGVEVNVEAALFVSWALQRIGTVAEVLPWLKYMPVGLEIIASTVDRTNGRVVTDVACMRIDYGGDSKRQSYYTCQFHPELDGSLRDVRQHKQPSYVQKSHTDDGARLLMRLLQG